MLLSNFFKINKCPICKNKLSLYVNASNSDIFKLKSINNKKYIFQSNLNEDYFILNKLNQIKFSSVKFSLELIPSYLDFFYICNEEKIESNKYNCKITVYDCCYISYFPKQEFIKNNKLYYLNNQDSTQVDLTNVLENVCFSYIKDQKENVYVLSKDFVKKIIQVNLFTFDSINMTENKVNFELPFNFNFYIEKEALISKLNNYIMLL